MKKTMYPRGIEVTEDLLSFTARSLDEISAQGTGEKPTVMIGRYFDRPLMIGKDAAGEPAIQSGCPQCCLVAVKTAPGAVRIGWAKRHSTNEDSIPTKKDILSTAVMRALGDTVAIESKNFAKMSSGAGLPRKIAGELSSFVERAKRYFKDCELVNLK